MIEKMVCCRHLCLGSCLYPACDYFLGFGVLKHFFGLKRSENQMVHVVKSGTKIRINSRQT